jgi:hypothetical protein
MAAKCARYGTGTNKTYSHNQSPFFDLNCETAQQVVFDIAARMQTADAGTENKVRTTWNCIHRAQISDHSHSGF